MLRALLYGAGVGIRGAGARRRRCAPAIGIGSSSLSFSSSISPPSTSPPSQVDSYIVRAKRFGAQALLGRLIASPRFDRVLAGLTVTRVDEQLGEVDTEFVVAEGLQNTYLTLHGGAIATLVDVIGTMALLAKDPTRAGVSVDLSVSYLGAAKAGEMVKCCGRALRVGRKLGFSSVELRRASDGTLLAVGRHTKAYS